MRVFACVPSLARLAAAPLRCGRTSSVAGRADIAEELFAAMVERGIEPDVTAYNALLHVFAQECAAQRALELVDEMTEKVRMAPRVPLEYPSSTPRLEYPSSTPRVPYCT